MDNVLHKLRKLDAYPKINEDFYSRTFSGGLITLVSFIVIFLLFFSELSMLLSLSLSLSLSQDSFIYLFIWSCVNFDILYIQGVKQSLVFKLWVLESEKKSMLFWGLGSSILFGDSHFLCSAICQGKILLLYFLYASYQSFSLCSTNSHKFSFTSSFLLLLFSYMWIQKMTWASSDCSLILDFKTNDWILDLIMIMIMLLIP